MQEHPYSNVALRYSGESLFLVDDDGNDVTEALTAPSSERLPDFLIVGMEKCATTWLLFALAAHPDIFALPFETDYFNEHARTVPFGQYRKLFSPVKPLQVCGEKTPNYAAVDRYPGTLDRIRDALPDVKLILCLRDPVERTVSAWRYHCRDRQGSINIGNFEDQFIENGAVSPSLAENYALRESLYPPVIRRLHDLFPAGNVLVHFVEDDIRNDPEGCLARTYEFLGVDTAFLPPRHHGVRNMTMEIPFDLSGHAKSILYDYFAPSMDETFSLLGRSSDVWRERKADSERDESRRDAETRIKVLGHTFTGPEAVQFVQHMIDTRQLRGAVFGLEALHAAYPDNASFRDTLAKIKNDLAG